MLKRSPIITAILLATLTLLAACDIPGLPGGAPNPEGATVYNGPVEQGVAAGQLMPGTTIRYVGRTEDKTAEVLINDQRAYKRTGGSLNWQGSPLDGADLDLNQRVLWFDEEQLQVAGTVRLILYDTNPTPGLIPQQPDEPSPDLAIFKVPVTYNVKSGEMIPGTTLSYVGPAADGAEISGLPEGEYPFRKSGDSIDWQGQLRARVYLDLVVRATVYNEDTLNVTGLATVMLALRH